MPHCLLKAMSIIKKYRKTTKVFHHQSYIFPTLITRTGALKRKDHLDAATIGAHNVEGTSRGTATATGADIGKAGKAHGRNFHVCDKPAQKGNSKHMGNVKVDLKLAFNVKSVVNAKSPFVSFVMYDTALAHCDALPPYQFCK